MAKQIHHCALFEYQGKTYLYEFFRSREMLLGDFLLKFVDDLLTEDPSRVVIEKVDIVFNGEDICHYPHFSLTRPVVRPVKLSTGSACALRR